MVKKKRCANDMPAAEWIDGVPYMERWVIYCPCGMTVFGNSKEECEASWQRHKEGKL